MIKKITTLTSLFLILSLTESHSAARPIRSVDRRNVQALARFLDPNNDAHVVAFMNASKEDRVDRDHYVGLGLLAPLGGAPVGAGPAGGGIQINYDDETSLRHFAIIFLRKYALPHDDDLYILAAYDLLRDKRAIPTKDQIEDLYESRLTPFIRQLNRLKKDIDRVSYKDLKKATEDLMDELPELAKDTRKVKTSPEAAAIIALMKQLVNQQTELLKAAKNTKVSKELSYTKRDMMINIFLNPHNNFSTAAGEARLLEEFFSSQRTRNYARYLLSYNTVTKNYKTELKSAIHNGHLPLIKMLKLPYPNPKWTSKELATNLFERMTPASKHALPVLIDNLVPPNHAGALLHWLLKDPMNRFIYTDFIKATDKKPREFADSARMKEAIMNALSQRQLTPLNQKPLSNINERRYKNDAESFMKNLNELLQNAVKKKEE
ncbi:MAG: hypothetical protein ACK5PQ_03100 [Alphaproteobacteria bacterium]